MSIDWRHQYDYERDAIERALTDITCDDPSLTQQHFAKDADINVLVERFRMDKTPLPPGVVDPRYYGDVSEAPDLRTVLERTREATEHFNALPPRLRSRFSNSPAMLWEFLNDPANYQEAVDLGILVKPPADDVPADQAGG